MSLWGLSIAAGIACACFATRAHAQPLTSRIAGLADGSVTFHFTGRPGVCGDGDSFVRLGRSFIGRMYGDMHARPCDHGPIQVRVTRLAGEVERIETWAGPLRQREGRELGQVSAMEAASYLLHLAATARTSVSSRAILPAVLADSVVSWPALLRIARDATSRSRGTRQEAVQWLARFAASAMAGRPNQLSDEAEDADDASGDAGLKSHAVFVLSQLPRHEGVPALLDVARQNPDPRTRGHALFWLGQSGDPRALDFIESMLRR